MNQGISADQRHRDFVQQQQDRHLAQSAINANTAAAELIAERIASKLAEQNEIIYKVGQTAGPNHGDRLHFAVYRWCSRAWSVARADLGLAGHQANVRLTQTKPIGSCSARSAFATCGRPGCRQNRGLLSVV